MFLHLSGLIAFLATTNFFLCVFLYSRPTYAFTQYINFTSMNQKLKCIISSLNLLVCLNSRDVKIIKKYLISNGFKTSPSFKPLLIKTTSENPLPYIHKHLSSSSSISPPRYFKRLLCERFPYENAKR
jgi:hypothetical protein